MEAMLKAEEVALLVGKSPRRVQQLAKSGQFRSEMRINERGRPMVLIPLSGLPVEAQQKYYSQCGAMAKAEKPKLPTKKKEPIQAASLEEFSGEERGEISFWMQTVAEWQEFRGGIADKAAADAAFVAVLQARHPELNVSRDVLYARQRAIKANDLWGLVDSRGKARRGYSKIDRDAWEAFLYFYLDESQFPVRECYKYTELWAAKNKPEVLPLPDYTTFYRHIKTDVPMPVRVLGREGDKAYKDRCGPYIRRVYEGMAANEWWIADNHTFDVITEGADGKRHRLYLTAFFDARSGIFTGCYVTNAPSSQSTLIALRRGILKYGIPENIYVDNGREFLTFDIGGLGHRKKKYKDGKEPFSPPPVFERLGIHMTNAIVRNAKAKIIERRFCDVKNQLSRLFETFCGGTVVEKPERLKHVLKNGNVILDGDFTAAVEELLEGWFNESAYGGAVEADRGKPRMQVWQEQLKCKRVAPADELNLMLMRSSRPQTVGRNGVTVKLAGAVLDYYTPEFTLQYQGKKVYYRYDPDDLRKIRVYDLEDRFVCELPCRDDMVLKYGADKDSVAAAMGQIRRYQKMVKSELVAQTGALLQTYGEQTAFDLALAAARQNRQARIVAPEDVAPPLVELQRAQERPLLKVVGGEDIVDFGRLTANSIKHNGGIKQDEDL